MKKNKNCQKMNFKNANCKSKKNFNYYKINLMI